MKGICGSDCSECKLFNTKCKGCKNTNGCPFGKKCIIADYIEIGGKDNYELLKKELIDEFNSLNVEGMPKIEELYPLNGKYINLEFVLPNNKKVRILNDNEIYLGNQVECRYNDEEIKKYFGIATNMSFLFVCEYEEYGNNPEIILYKRR